MGKVHKGLQHTKVHGKALAQMVALQAELSRFFHGTPFLLKIMIETNYVY